ncbi:MAG: hypothetical protein ACO1PI_09195 [Bacteroidota bacterium]
MKNQIKLMLVAVAALALTATSCKKDVEESVKPTPTPTPTATKTQLLTAKSWKRTSMVSRNIELFTFMPDCEKDNVMSFKSNLTYISDEGASKCTPTAPQTENGSWKFINAEAAMLIDNTDTMIIKKLTADTLRAETSFDDDEGGRETVVVTFVAIK